MYSTTAYLYQQRYPILLIDVSGQYFTARWNPVYSKPITINKGVDNVLLFEFLNQDQKPVNVTGSTFVFRLITQDGLELLYQQQMEILSAVYGRVKVTIPTADTYEFQAQPASYGITRSSGNLTQATFVDEGANGRGVAQILDSVYPEFVPSQTVTLPTMYGPPDYPSTMPDQSRPDWALPVQSTPFSAQENYSSFVTGNPSAVATFILELDHFTGNIKVQGSSDYQSLWYDASDNQSFYANTGNVAITTLTTANILRLAINQYGGVNGATTAQANATVVNGAVTSVNLINPGYGYLAAPLVTILGAGAGATAEATINNSGVITNITVTNGGSGYSAVPPSNSPAAVVISPGLIKSVTYR
jgi:hypothetical protein